MTVRATETLENLLGVEECIHWYPPNLSTLADPRDVFQRAGVEQREVDLFVHIPFCSSKCGFCPFNVFRYDEGQSASYLAALREEVRLIREMYDLSNVRFRTAWVGGGTPSTLDEDVLDGLLGFLSDSFDLTHAREFTVEVKPDLSRLTDGKIERMRERGVTRISMGVQSTQQEYLDLLGRRHLPDEAFAVIDMIRGHGMPLNIDMMYRLPGETLAEVEADVDAVRSLGIEHISWFNYVPHEGTGLAAKIQRGRVVEPADRDGYFTMFERVAERMAASGYEQYTPYHFAGSARCEYHVDRWGMPQLETLGLGAGAFSFFNGWTYANEHSLARYAEATRAGRPPVMMGKRLDRRETITRLAVLGSKLFTLDKDVFREVAGVSMDEFYGNELELLERLELVNMTETHVECTQVGKAFSNDIAAVFGTDAAKRVPQPQGVQLQRASR